MVTAVENQIYTSSTYEGCTCWNCGIKFFMPQHFVLKRQEDKKSFYCPNGHSAVYGKGELERARRELEDERQRKAAIESRLALVRAEAKHNLVELKKTKTRLKNVKHRVAHGVCPCCTRTFQNLARHMETKHPGQLIKSE